MKKLFGITLGLLFGLLLAFILLEGTVRLMGTEDADGNFTVLNRQLKPYRLPIQAVEEQVAAYQASDSSYVIYDAELGWTHRPNSASQNGNYLYNSQGVRTGPDRPVFSAESTEDVLRIALFGDSFVHGDDVPYEATWAYYLEQSLAEEGVAVEILNFGVGGYGIDQAYWRWQTAGKAFTPDLVLFGFQPTDVWRNVNILRPLNIVGGGLPFSKPRAVLEQSGLRVLNRPALLPEEVPQTMRNIDTWPLVEYEWFYDEDDFSGRWWQRSRALALLAELIAESTGQTVAEEAEWYAISAEPAQLTTAIIDEFATEVEATGAQFAIVHLPKWSHVDMIRDGTTLPYIDLLDTLKTDYTTIDPGPALALAAEEHGIENVFIAHYAPLGNQIVANELANWLLNNEN
ncbi:MAG: SGNH/GDSL hydrolase family protein [Anaerolineae bacterium]|nr:SGNH/GDSL hydrolase family protein [Anaerolineae bacterium]MCO5196132.1 SGNH/GDSL hydrolase family protein [Anaerolineae bacterium]